MLTAAPPAATATIPPTPGPAGTDALTAIRAQVSFPVFVPAAPPPGLTPEPPMGGDTPRSLVQITYHTADGAVGLLVTDGPAGCCLAAGGMPGGTPVTLANGLAAHALPGTPASGGPILWWEQGVTYVALSGPQQTQAALEQIAANMSRTAGLGPTAPVPARPSPAAIATPAFAILRPAWLPDGLTEREEVAQQPGPDGPVSYALLHYNPAESTGPTDALLLIEQPAALAPPLVTAVPGTTPQTIGGHMVTVDTRGGACTTLSWIEGDVYLQLVNSYDDAGNIRYSCADMQHIVQSVP